MENYDRPVIDRVDLRLLDILQRQAGLSVAEVAARARLSTTTCWRRIQLLEQNGVIKSRVALLDRNALGLDVTIFAHVNSPALDATPSQSSKLPFATVPRCSSAIRSRVSGTSC